MFGSASQGGEQADQLYLGMLGSLIASLWSAAEYLLNNIDCSQRVLGDGEIISSPFLSLANNIEGKKW